MLAPLRHGDWRDKGGSSSRRARGLTSLARLPPWHATRVSARVLLFEPPNTLVLLFEPPQHARATV